MNLTHKVHLTFGPVLKEYNKKVSDLKELNTVDDEFRKNHLIQQDEKFNSSHKK